MIEAIAWMAVGALIMFVLMITVSPFWWLRKDRTSHLCHHINGAHRCRCRHGRDHSDAKHDDNIIPALYDWRREGE